MRYYAEWLDAEYVVLNHKLRGYDHAAVMQRSGLGFGDLEYVTEEELQAALQPAVQPGGRHSLPCEWPAARLHAGSERER